MCERKADREKTKLPPKFWNHPDWKKEFLKQLTICSRILKKYPPEVIIKAIARPELKWIYSFGGWAKWEKYLKEELKKFEQEKVFDLQIAKDNTFYKSSSSNNLRSKLK